MTELSSYAPDLFGLDGRVSLASGAVVLRRFALACATDLLVSVEEIATRAPFRHFTTPGGHHMTVAMTNCGEAGWVSDRKGYRYDGLDLMTNRPWPPMPPLFAALARQAAGEAGYQSFTPDACLINRYLPGARLTLHQDRNECDFDAPIVSVSLGLSAKFLFGGLKRSDKIQRIMLHHGDVAVWGGPSRLAFHGVDAMKDGEHPATGRCRINLTFRRAL
jgi:alkylated DNA repair protein (DNA oxidative demethylase)